MQGSQQPPITRSGPPTVGERSLSARRTARRSPLQNVMGRRFGRLEVISGEVRRRKGHSRLLTRCATCGSEGWRAWDGLRRGTAGCRKCGRREVPGREALRVPKWLYQRAQAAQQRCVNPNDSSYSRYGERGIEFRFESPRAMARWVQENLGAHRDMELDRIDNDGHYEPGNLRWATPAQNVANSRKARVSEAFHAFRLQHPEVRYADSTLRGLLLDGLTFEEIVARYERPSRKAKGVYGTYSTPDPAIALRWEGSSSQIA